MTARGAVADVASEVVEKTAGLASGNLPEQEGACAKELGHGCPGSPSGLGRRGPFRFQGGCFDCHEKKAFPRAHDHEIATLQECGMCHHAHGSTTKAPLTMAKQLACKQCHN